MPASMQNRALSPIADDTERLLGSAEVRQLLKISQSSLERRVREKAVPAPRKIGGKNVWRASEINAYGASLFAAEVRALSVTSVDQLRPDEVEDTAVSLAVRALSTRLGVTITPEAVTISTSRPATPSEAADQLAGLVTKSPFSGLDLQSTFIVAAGLFPELRALWKQHTLNGYLMADNDVEALKRAQIVLAAASGGKSQPVMADTAPKPVTARRTDA